MRILYIDIDSLRPDHLGCYGYHRNTSPNIDQIAQQGVRFNNHYATDVPCLPSRTSLFGGRFGIHNGVINHGGVASEPFIEGKDRGFESTLSQTSWMACLAKADLHTATISPFGERHSAWHWYANFNEIHNTGKRGMERADEVAPIALDWINRNAAKDNWFLHVNLWDPHTPYRTPSDFGDPFADEPLPSWLNENVRQKHWQGAGPHSAQEVNGYDNSETTYDGDFPRQPVRASNMTEVRRMFDGYDTGVLYADHYVGKILEALAAQNILDDTVIVISSDHGEALGELNVYGDHQYADHPTAHIPLIVRWPGVTDSQAGRADNALHYHFDFAATMIDLLGQPVPDIWDGRSFATALTEARELGRDYLVLSQGAWSCQRSVRFRANREEYLCIRSYHAGHRDFPDVMLFDVKNDPHQTVNLASQRPALCSSAMEMLDRWYAEMMETATHPHDPMMTVLDEGGPLHIRGELPAYLTRLRETGRSEVAAFLEQQYRTEIT